MKSQHYPEYQTLVLSHDEKESLIDLRVRNFTEDIDSNVQMIFEVERREFKNEKSDWNEMEKALNSDKFQGNIAALTFNLKPIASVSDKS